VFRIVFAICMLYGAMQCVAHAACSSDDVMTKGSDISDVLGGKVQSNPDGASKMMSELGDLMGATPVTDQTCTKLDALSVRAKKL
jgi:hypothetical protein